MGGYVTSSDSVEFLMWVRFITESRPFITELVCLKDLLVSDTFLYFLQTTLMGKIYFL